MVWELSLFWLVDWIVSCVFGLPGFLLDVIFLLFLSYVLFYLAPVRGGVFFFLKLVHLFPYYFFD